MLEDEYDVAVLDKSNVIRIPRCHLYLLQFLHSSIWLVLWIAFRLLKGTGNIEG